MTAFLETYKEKVLLYSCVNAEVQSTSQTHTDLASSREGFRIPALDKNIGGSRKAFLYKL